MSTWRQLLLEQFPEFGHAPESWELVEVGSNLGSLLQRAAQDGNSILGARVLTYVFWADGQGKHDERFVYLCQEALHGTVASPSLRSFFASLLNERTLAQLTEYVLYGASEKVLAEISENVRLNRRGA